MTIIYGIVCTLSIILFLVLGVCTFIYTTKVLQRNVEQITGTLAISFSVLVMACIAIPIADSMKLKNNEVLNYVTVSMIHKERWSQRETRTREVYVGTDRKGNSKYRTETYYVTEYYGPYWISVCSNGEFDIDEGDYNKWKNVWRNERQIGMNKGSAAGFTTPINGKIYSTYWTHKLEHVRPISVISQYTNKVRCSNSVFNTGKNYDKNIEKMFPRPADVKNVEAVHSFGVNISDAFTTRMNQLNAVLGERKQIHMMYYMFDASKYTRDIVSDILCVWNGPNKNELVVFCGVDNSTQELKWVEVHSWMDKPIIHSYIQNELVTKKLDVNNFIKTMTYGVEHYWERKNFKDFEYIDVQMRLWCVITYVSIFIAVLIVSTVLVAYFIINAKRSKIDYRNVYYRKNF